MDKKNLPSNHRLRSLVRSTPSSTSKPYLGFANNTLRTVAFPHSTGPNTKIPGKKKKKHNQFSYTVCNITYIAAVNPLGEFSTP